MTWFIVFLYLFLGLSLAAHVWKSDKEVIRVSDLGVVLVFALLYPIIIPIFFFTKCRDFVIADFSEKEEEDEL